MSKPKNFDKANSYLKIPYLNLYPIPFSSPTSYLKKIFLLPPPYTSTIPTLYLPYTYPLPEPKVQNTTKSPFNRKIYYHLTFKH